LNTPISNAEMAERAIIMVKKYANKETTTAETRSKTDALPQPATRVAESFPHTSKLN
jgi:hypothetical protein